MSLLTVSATAMRVTDIKPIKKYYPNTAVICLAINVMLFLNVHHLNFMKRLNLIAWMLVSPVLMVSPSIKRSFGPLLDIFCISIIAFGYNLTRSNLSAALQKFGPYSLTVYVSVCINIYHFIPSQSFSFKCLFIQANCYYHLQQRQPALQKRNLRIVTTKIADSAVEIHCNTMIHTWNLEVLNCYTNKNLKWTCFIYKR